MLSNFHHHSSVLYYIVTLASFQFVNSVASAIQFTQCHPIHTVPSRPKVSSCPQYHPVHSAISSPQCHLLHIAIPSTQIHSIHNVIP
ncbi:hypothetical protein E2C01_019194 [Portunus trituberculatus]|uniref:Uncharacterized protein n=1 Tax=Portunus trituberculatus TaxID=210409 RepID=A0A5B7DZB1_PORTR|nr:hypothetical protein [Portunus trituberculatus]